MPARLQRVFAVNIVGSFLCAREAVRRMSTRHGGSGGAIVNLSSGASRLGSPGEYVDYAASKGAIDTMTIGLAKEVAEEGIRVNAVRAGFIYTDIHASGGEPDRVERVKSLVPMKRGGTAGEVAAAFSGSCPTRPRTRPAASSMSPAASDVGPSCRRVLSSSCQPALPITQTLTNQTWGSGFCLTEPNGLTLYLFHQI